jgi:hypothetical protein
MPITSKWALAGLAFAELALWQEFLLVGLALTSFVYVFYFRIWIALATGSDLVFAFALGVAVTSVATAAPFDWAGFELVERSSLPQALESADQQLAAIEALPGELIDRALAHLGVEPEVVTDTPDWDVPGPFEANIRPSVEALVSVVLRGMSFLCASLLLLIALAMRSSTSTARAMQGVAARAEALEHQVAEMRAGSSAPRSTPPSN